MLTSLSGRSHRVLTGVMLRDTHTNKTALFAVSTDVHFRILSGEEIEDYCSTDEPYDKAGGYGIQGRGCTLVERIEGDYFNIVGLPVAEVVRKIKNI